MVELTADWLDALLEVGWCGAAAWWWKMEADADFMAMSKCSQCKYTMSKMLMRQFLESGDPWKSRVGDSFLDLWAVQGLLGVVKAES